MSEFVQNYELIHHENNKTISNMEKSCKNSIEILEKSCNFALKIVEKSCKNA